jgi:hypothetical protein
MPRQHHLAPRTCSAEHPIVGAPPFPTAAARPLPPLTGSSARGRPCAGSSWLQAPQTTRCPRVPLQVLALRARHTPAGPCPRPARRAPSPPRLGLLSAVPHRTSTPVAPVTYGGPTRASGPGGGAQKPARNPVSKTTWHRGASDSSSGRALPSHLRAIAPLGSQAAEAKRQGQKARQDAEQHGVWEALSQLKGAVAPRLQTELTGVYWPEEWPG